MLLFGTVTPRPFEHEAAGATKTVLFPSRNITISPLNHILRECVDRLRETKILTHPVLSVDSPLRVKVGIVARKPWGFEIVPGSLLVALRVRRCRVK